MSVQEFLRQLPRRSFGLSSKIQVLAPMECLLRSFLLVQVALRSCLLVQVELRSLFLRRPTLRPFLKARKLQRSMEVRPFQRRSPLQLQLRLPLQLQLLSRLLSPQSLLLRLIRSLQWFRPQSRPCRRFPLFRLLSRLQ